jgi:hypothetical protein
MAQFVPAEHAPKVTASAAITNIEALLAIRWECGLVISPPPLAHLVRFALGWAVTIEQAIEFDLVKYQRRRNFPRP